MWQDLDLGFKTAFEMAWEGYRHGSRPIGAAIVDVQNLVTAAGRSQCDDDGPGLISRHELAHAEVNAILQIGETDVRIIHEYTLYTTMEPCPFCFGAIIMSDIGHVEFGARDRLAGAVGLNNALDYITEKDIRIEGPFYEAEVVQMALLACHAIETGTNPKALGHMLGLWSADCTVGVEIGRLLAAEAILKAALEVNEPFGSIFDDIIQIAGAM